ncbi:dynein regulatory complex protein 10 [Hemicordylus capensis]|uniref:dynein regulatory complex protein 10 n=1 Tax=Hemicordylus capensis TaxID=884348 RepID=UPI0023041770|nr:dynein regulatory complex protein 10 [Hemicordylus capensis]
MATEVLNRVYEAVDPSRSPVGQATRTLTLKMPLKILDPGRSKLTTVETKRIISVLDETILKVELVSMFAYVMENLEDFYVALGPELTEALREHLQLSNNLKATLVRLEEDDLLYKGTARRVILGAEDPDGSLSLLVQGLKGSVRNIVRLFYANPLACQAIRDASAYGRDTSSDLLIRGLTELREFLFEKLLTTPLEEREKHRFIQEIALRDKKNTETIAALEDELAAAIQHRDDEISKKNTIIKELKTHLHNLAKISDGQIQRTRTEAEKQQKGELRGSQAKCAKLQQELQQLRAQLSTLITEDRDSELGLRKKKYKVEMEIENWVQKYDAEMIEKQDEYEEIDAVYVVEKAQLAELRERFELLDQEYSQIKEERRVKREQKEKAEKELAILVRAATLIQALWKGYLVRSLLRGKRKKKGRGKRGRR